MRIITKQALLILYFCVCDGPFPQYVAPLKPLGSDAQ